MGEKIKEENVQLILDSVLKQTTQVIQENEGRSERKSQNSHNDAAGVWGVDIGVISPWMVAGRGEVFPPFKDTATNCGQMTF